MKHDHRLEEAAASVNIQLVGLLKSHTHTHMYRTHTHHTEKHHQKLEFACFATRIRQKSNNEAMKQQSPHVQKLELGSVLSSGFGLKSWVGEICKEEQQLYKLLLLLLGDECILDTITTHKFEV
jgi:hypothetical protein